MKRSEDLVHKEKSPAIQSSQGIRGRRSAGFQIDHPSARYTFSTVAILPQNPGVGVAEFRFKLDERTGIRVGRPPVGARMLGPSDASMRAEIRFQPEEHGGTFHIRTKEVPDAAFRVQADVGRAGNLVLQTCLLRPREKPYDLALELARHRVKTYIHKCEDWLMFNPGLAPVAGDDGGPIKDRLVPASK